MRLSEFSSVSEDQLAKIISKCKPTSSSVDPIPTKIVLDCLDVLLPVLVDIINSSLHSAIVPKTAVIKPLLKKNGLDPNLCKSHRPVSNFLMSLNLYSGSSLNSFVCRLNQHDLLDKFQSAYRLGTVVRPPYFVSLMMFCAMQMVVTRCFSFY